MKLNKDWHLHNIMPENPTMEQRIAWHLAHAQHCACREIPAKLAEEMKKRNIELPQTAIK